MVVPPPHPPHPPQGAGGLSTHRVCVVQLPSPIAVHDVQPPALVIGAVGGAGDLGGGERQHREHRDPPPTPNSHGDPMSQQWEGKGGAAPILAALTSPYLPRPGIQASMSNLRYAGSPSSCVGISRTLRGGGGDGDTIGTPFGFEGQDPN